MRACSPVFEVNARAVFGNEVVTIATTVPVAPSSSNEQIAAARAIRKPQAVRAYGESCGANDELTLFEIEFLAERDSFSGP